MLKILLVDDDVGILEAVKEELEESGRHKVYTAVSGYEAIKSLGDISVDLIITDWKMPDGDGKWVLSQLEARNESIPVIVFTGCDELSEHPKSFGGVIGVIKKGEANLSREIGSLFKKKHET